MRLLAGCVGVPFPSEKSARQQLETVTVSYRPGDAHNLPPAKWLEQRLDFLDTGKGVKPAEAK